MKKNIVFLIIICALLAACDQEPLFWDIAHEIPPIEAMIDPAYNIVANNSDPAKPVLYVASEDVWTWDTNDWDTDVRKPAWKKMSPQPGGKIRMAAVTGTTLFSLDWNGTIKKFDGTNWSGVTVPAGKAERIYGAGNYVFAGCLTGTPGTKDGYSIFAIDASGSVAPAPIKSGTGLLSGAAQSGAYYLGTIGKGILQTNGTSEAASVTVYEIKDGNTNPIETPAIIIGLINHDGTIVAITSARQLLYENTGGFTLLASYSAYFSGAMASWKNENGDRLLLLGLFRSSGNFRYGYREIIWEKEKDITFNKSLSIPGEDILSSVKQDYQYTSGISNHVVVGLYALPYNFSADEKDRPIVYACTQKFGLWAYRTRRGAAQWNGEDNSSGPVNP
jgi:hypothetical protein